MSKQAALCVLLVYVAILPAGCRRAPASPPPPTPEPVAATSAPATLVADPSPTLTADPTSTPIPGSGLLVALDPGHGGEDLGARHFNRQGEMDLYESTINLQLALRTGEKLKARGFRVFYTRDGDYDPNLYEFDADGDGDIDLRDVVQARTDLVNEAGADVLLSIHLNSWESKDEELLRATGGTETYYCSERPFADKNLRLASLVHENVLAALRRVGYESSDRGLKIGHEPAYPGDPGRHLMMLGPVDDVIVRASEMPGVLSEPMFITCDVEAALMQREDVQEALAEAYAGAIAAFFEEQGQP